MKKIIISTAAAAALLSAAVGTAAAGPIQPLSIDAVSAEGSGSDVYPFTPPVTAPQTIHYND